MSVDIFGMSASKQDAERKSEADSRCNGYLTRTKKKKCQDCVRGVRSRSDGVVTALNIRLLVFAARTFAKRKNLLSITKHAGSKCIDCHVAVLFDGPLPSDTPSLCAQQFQHLPVRTRWLFLTAVPPLMRTVFSMKGTSRQFRPSNL
ncbi:MAG: hypothetical protein ACKVY0_15800 [Prosthecobacter sp.]|uniref:hypothetical protein n=1 Tax=Prosthecobacter sp. TaxID=1965333 RepID=UPI0038FD5B91